MVGLESTDHNPYDGPVRHAKYPMVWCGGGVYGRSKGIKSVGEVWSSALMSKDKKTTFAVADRDKVTYYRQPPAK